MFQQIPFAAYQKMLDLIYRSSIMRHIENDLHHSHLSILNGLFMVLLLAVGCGSSDEPDLSKLQFSVLINDELFVPDLSGTASYYNGVLGFGAIDTIDQVGNDEKFLIFFRIEDPKPGLNTVDHSINTSSIQLYKWVGRSGSSGFATSGDFTLTEFDTINGVFSGTFDCIFDYKAQDFYYELTDGQFNGFTLRDLFCEPELPLQSPDSISIFNHWGLAGFSNPDGSYSYPPCSTNSWMIITADSLDTTMAYIDAKGPINSLFFAGKFQILEDSTFVSGSVGSTRAGGSEWELDYERQLIDFLENDTIRFSIQGHELIFSNTTSSSQLVYKTIEELNPYD